MSEIRVVVPGWPIAWARPSTAGGRARGHRDRYGQWRPARAERQLETLRDYVWAARQQFRGAWDAGGAVSVDAEFRFARAPRAGDAGEGQTLVVVRQLPPDGYRAKQPDVDNLAKLVLEAVDHAGIVVDDRQVVELAARKIHGVAAPRARQGGE